MSAPTISQLVDELKVAIDQYDQVIPDPLVRYRSLEDALHGSQAIAAHFNRARITALREARGKAMSASDIADHLGISRQRVHQLLRSGSQDDTQRNSAPE